MYVLFDRVSSSSRVLLICAAIAIVLASPSLGVAGPPYMEFIEGLRARGYYDITLDYLNQIDEDKSVPQDVKVLIPFERATTLVQSARTKRDYQSQLRELDLASAQLDQFLKASPKHPRAAEANTERARIGIGKAQALLLEAKSPSKEAIAGDLRQQARKFILESRKQLTEAKDRYEQIWKQFGVSLSADEREKRAARDQAETQFMSAQLDLAQTTYLEAQTYEEGSKTRNDLLKKAAEEYEAITERYRTMIAGLYAKLWRAKCFEERAVRPEEGKRLPGNIANESRDNLRRAEALYRELLENEVSQSATAQQIQDTARMFYLIVRNHPLNADHAIVVQEASDWLATRRGAAATSQTALGVRWQRAIAYEQLANDPDLNPNQATINLRNALKDAEFLVAYPGEYRDIARSMVQRIKAAMGRGSEDPADFDEAYGLATGLVQQIDPLQAEVNKAKGDKKKEAKTRLDAHLEETSRILKLSLKLADESVAPAQLDRTRYLLSYVYFLMGRTYDAAVLGEYVAQHPLSDKTKSDLPADAGYVALMAFITALNEVPKGQDDSFEMDQTARVATMIVTDYPLTQKADDARMNLGILYNRRDEPRKAAEWFEKVAKSSERYAEAQLAAGQAYWNAYLQALPGQDGELTDDLRDELKKSAQKYLERGIAESEKAIPANNAAPDNLIAGKLSLVQILNSEGNNRKAVDVLTKDPHSVIRAIAVKDESKRPKSGVKSQAFAALTFRQLLRAQIGLQEIDAAINTMKQLEQTGGEGNTEVFVELGRQIKEEIERLPEGEQRQNVLKTFDQFLGKLADMKQGQSFSSLLWIAETYFGLAEAVDGQTREKYFDRSADAYTSIIEKINQPKFAPDGSAPGIQLRLAAVQRARGNYEAAYNYALEVLRANPKALNAQTEAAQILQAWGENGSPDKFKLALMGDSSSGAEVWGWGQIAQRLQRLIEAGRDTPAIIDSYLQARYTIAEITRESAKEQSGDAGKEDLSRARQQLLIFAAVTPREMISDEWWGRYDQLYQDIQRDIAGNVVGFQPEPLAAPEKYEPEVVTTAKPVTPPAVVPTAPTVAPPPTSTNWLLVGVGVLIAVGVTVGFVVMAGSGGGRKHRRYTSAPPLKSRQKAEPASGSGKKTRSASASSSATATKKRTVKRRPKPPEAPSK
ncbi:tetratricopeptide repeat protein [Calycomorphotria hydatis]|uniref:Tetratricopeptide repeat protein n=1 Tax=Calycomorphotria hydatis TaxID=2528027 RepID=A0A517TBU3_9PLAN|nr:hypothetical protein [Calycomorphotria hydatis]QDT65846.1 hypothetical protein V22_31080 [Calycomorphotria hydatis]